MAEPLPPPLMSLRAYAKRRGVTPMAVSNAVRTGRLKASVSRDTFGQPKINDPFLADKEWAANTDLSRAPQAARENADRAAARSAEALAAAGLAAPTDEAEAAEDAEDSSGVPEISIAAQRAKHWDAKLKELKYREAAAELVPAKDVERKLVDVFLSCRSRLLALPSRARQALPHLSVSDVGTIESLVREALEALAHPGGEEP